MERFWNKVNKNGPIPTHAPELGQCWLWTGFIRANGYGQITTGGKTIKAHRLSWMLENGDIESDMDCCHKCDNRKCVRPSHLFIGTRSDNMRDLVAKGRHKAASKTHCCNGHPLSGENLILVKRNGVFSYRRCRTCHNAQARQTTEEKE